MYWENWWWRVVIMMRVLRRRRTEEGKSYLVAWYWMPIHSPQPSQRSGGCSTITEERGVSWNWQHPSRTGPSRWWRCNHRSHDSLQQDLAEIKVPSVGDTELEGSPFKIWGRSVYSHTCYAYCQGFLPANFYPSGPFACIFSKFLLIFSCISSG